MKRTLLILVMSVMPLFVEAQGLMEVYDLSQSTYQGTAKSAAMGNAMGAVGQDYSAISINPAGLGLFRHSTVVFTPGIYIADTKSKFFGNNASGCDIRIPINNIGVALAYQKSGFLKSLNFSFGMNRINNYTKESLASGNNYTSSLVDAYMAEVNYYNSQNPYAQITDERGLRDEMYSLWKCYLLDFDGCGNISSIVPKGRLNQRRGELKRGYINELSFSMGFNLDDKWFLGFSLDIPRLERRSTADYRETNLRSGSFVTWTQQENINTYGWGIGGKFGFIGFPAKWLRIGISFHTPTLYRLEENWNLRTSSELRYTSHNNNQYNTATSVYNYKLTTPLRFDVSAAFILSNRAMLSFDYELVNYKGTYLSCRDYDYSGLNNLITNRFKISSNFRVGGEYRVKNVCFRAGYALYGSPFGLEVRDFRTCNYSVGIGYSVRFFTFDFAYVYSRMQNDYYIYEPYSTFIPEGDDVAANTVNEVNNVHQLLFSFKFRLN